jgi:hypothetical protein
MFRPIPHWQELGAQSTHRSFHSGTREAQGDSTWLGHVGCLISVIALQASCVFMSLSISSWEFVTTLDYEWNVFRGYRQYLWTIWVSSSRDSDASLLIRVAHEEPHTDHLLLDIGLFTDAPGHAYGYNH